MPENHAVADRIVQLARDLGVLRVRDLRERGIHPEYLRRLCHRGVLRRTGWGLYVLAGVQYSEQLSLAEAAKRVPDGIVCLLSALQVHEFGTARPGAVWMMVPRRAHRPKVEHPPIRLVLASRPALTAGAEMYCFDGVDVRVTSIAKTIADGFKYRRQIGLDVAIAALRECWRGRRCPLAELRRYATLCRVARVMQPFLEAMV